MLTLGSEGFQPTLESGDHVSAHFLAFDLGAESGRAIVGRLRDKVLDIREVHRFPNEAVRQNGSLHWDILRLWHEMRRSFDKVDGAAIDSLGVDTWGCDYALLGERGELLQNPFHYRDSRTDGVMDAVCKRVSADEIYGVTGIQFLPFNTLFQLYAACQQTPRLIDAADTVVTIPDLLNYWLTGSLAAEYTNATTTQFVDARSRAWAKDLLDALDIPTRLLPPLVEPGALVGRLKSDVCQPFAGTPVVAPACHDTGSAVASVAAGRRRAFLSSGTWSLLGAEVDAPIITSRSRELNFTNEGGVSGTTRLLKNIAGMWLLQACRQTWAAAGQAFEYGELLTMADDERLAFKVLFDPDHAAFLHPRDMVVGDRRVLPRDGAAGAGRPRRLYAGDPGEPGVQVPVRHRLPARADRPRDRGSADRRRRVTEPAAQPVHGRCDGVHGHRRPD